MIFTCIVIVCDIFAGCCSAAPDRLLSMYKNQTTKRYTYVRDNKGRIDVGATTADYDAIWLIKDDERPHYDPSGV